MGLDELFYLREPVRMHNRELGLFHPVAGADTADPGIQVAPERLCGKQGIGTSGKYCNSRRIIPSQVLVARTHDPLLLLLQFRQDGVDVRAFNRTADIRKCVPDFIKSQSPAEVSPDTR